MSAAVKMFLSSVSVTVLFLGLLFWFLETHSGLQVNQKWSPFAKEVQAEDWFVQFNDGSLGSLEK